MRIIHILHSHGYGGAENHAMLMMEGQRAAGHQVMFAGPTDSWIGRACQAAGIPSTHIAMHGLYDVISHWKLARLVKKWRPDVVHGHLIRGSMYAGIAGGASHRKPLAVCTAHATTAKTHMQRCDHIIAVSAAVKENLVASGYNRERISVIHNGVLDVPSPTAEARTETRKKLGIPEHITAVVNAGRFVHDKGQDLLIQALRDTPPEVHLYLIGDPNTDFGRALQALELKQSRVHYLGYRSDVQQILPAFDIYVLSSRREAMPLSLAEAFAAQLPVIATTVGGVPEIVHHEQTGLQVPAEDAQAICQALVRLHSTPQLAIRLAKNGRQYFEQNLTAERMVEQTLAVYQHGLASTRHA